MISLFLFLILSHQEPKKVVIMDSGLNPESIYNTNLCREGHRDFTGTDLYDDLGHGSNIYSIIANQIQNVNVCIISVKVFSRTGKKFDIKMEQKALQYIYSLKPDYLNLSWGGPVYNQIEYYELKKLLNSGIKITIAAGNKSKDLNKKCNFYPACMKLKHPNLKVIGNLDGKKKHFSSNFNGPINAWEQGTNVEGGGYRLTGTSQASANYMGKWIKNDLTKKN